MACTRATIFTGARAKSPRTSAPAQRASRLCGLAHRTFRRGQTTIATELERELFNLGKHAYVLDGDNIRHGLCSDLGFSPQDRQENIRRVGEVAKLFADAGVICITAFISPYRADRELVRNMVKPGQFIEVYVNAPIEVCEKRDPKGLYAKARATKSKSSPASPRPTKRPTGRRSCCTPTSYRSRNR